MPKERYVTKMYRMSQDGEREIKEICFDPNYGRLKQDYLDVLEELSQMSCIPLNIMKIVT